MRSVAGAEGAGSFDEFSLAHSQNLRADQAGIADPASEGQREDQVEDARSEKGDEGDGQQDSGERHEGVHHDDVQHAVGDAAVVAGDGAEDEAEGQRGSDDAAADQHGDPRAIDDAGEDVAAELVGAEPVRDRWSHQARAAGRCARDREARSRARRARRSRKDATSTTPDVASRL